MSDSPFGPVEKFYLSPTDRALLDEAERDLTFERHFRAAKALTMPEHPANLGPLEEDIEPLDRGSAKALGRGLILALAFWSAPFVIFGVWHWVVNR